MGAPKKAPGGPERGPMEARKGAPLQMGPRKLGKEPLGAKEGAPKGIPTGLGR
jgi:hypothetical protein